jgi:hypothetical protein
LLGYLKFSVEVVMSSPKGSTYECKLAGLVVTDSKETASGSAQPHVWDLLRGMCVRYELVQEYEYGLRFPLQSGTNSVAAKLITQIPKADARAKASDLNDNSYR